MLRSRRPQQGAILINAYLKAHEVTKNPDYLTHAKALANGMLAGQQWLADEHNGNGEIPTWNMSARRSYRHTAYRPRRTGIRMSGDGNAMMFSSKRPMTRRLAVVAEAGSPAVTAKLTISTGSPAPGGHRTDWQTRTRPRSASAPSRVRYQGL